MKTLLNKYFSLILKEEKIPYVTIIIPFILVELKIPYHANLYLLGT